MTFDEFSTKLKEIRADFLKAHGREMVSIQELEAFLLRRKFARSGGRSLKSLKGLGF